MSLQTLERRLLLTAAVSWEGGKIVITDAGNGSGESVVVGVDDGGYAAVTTFLGTVLWSGANENPKVVPDMVQGVTVTGSPYHDYIDLRQIAPGLFDNAAIKNKGSVSVDCSVSDPTKGTFGDTILLGAYGEDATGSPYADTIECDKDFAYGDTVNGGGGADRIFGGGGNDQLTLGGLGKNGNNKGPGFGKQTALIVGGGGSDTIVGGNMQSMLIAGQKNSTVTAGAYGDTIIGGAGSDTLTGGPGSDSIKGGAGDDIINGMGAPFNAPDTLIPGGGNDYVYYDKGIGFNPDGTPNDYFPPTGNHPAVGRLVAYVAAGGQTQTTFTVGDKFTIEGQGVRIPQKDNLETITTLTYYLDTNGLTQNPDGSWTVTGQPDNFLELGIPKDQELEAVPYTPRGNNGFLVDTTDWNPGKYTFFVIATASIKTPDGVAIQGNFKRLQITLEAPKVGINAAVPQTQELLAGQPGVFDVTRDGPTDSALTVNYTLSGTATNGTDYSTLSGTVTIPAGSADATIDVNPLDDGDGDDSTASESVVATLTSTSDYDVDPSASSATVNIAEEDPPTVSISADIPTAVENDTSQDGEYTISRTGPTDESLTVNLAASGTAVAGTNYVALPSSVTIPAGSQTAVLQVAALEDTPGSNDPETVTETIQPGSNYTIGSPSSADVSILEQPISTVTIAATTRGRSVSVPACA